MTIEECKEMVLLPVPLGCEESKTFSVIQVLRIIDDIYNYFETRCNNAKTRYEIECYKVEECSVFSTKQALEIVDLKKQIAEQASLQCSPRSAKYDIDHKTLSKHFNKTNEAMRQLKRKYEKDKTGLWSVYVKAYTCDESTKEH